MKFIEEKLITSIRVNITIVIVGLAISGITAFPLETELGWLVQHDGALPSAFQSWLDTVYQAIAHINQQYPFLSYGTDWLAFAHIILAVLFVGPLLYPVKNIWVMQFGMIACGAILPLAFIAGHIRGIPFFWQLIDCSFGLIGIIPLYFAFKATRRLEQFYFLRGIIFPGL